MAALLVGLAHYLASERLAVASRSACDRAVITGKHVAGQERNERTYPPNCSLVLLPLAAVFPLLLPIPRS